MNVLLAIFERSNKLILIVIGFILIVIVGFLDFLTGYEYSFSVFYVLPISLITWNSSQQLGFLASFASACIWLTAQISSGQHYSHSFILFWNTVIQFSFFCIIVILLTLVKNLVQRERQLARTDYLTSAVNSRCFNEIANMEIFRLQRYCHPLTIAYFDLDNFKAMNDKFGHSTGDRILQTVVYTIKKRVRKIDTIARLGGDEFALLLPETDDKVARILIIDIQNLLLEEMQKNNWAITFSIGVLTCKFAPSSIDELVTKVDNLMYLAKFDGKNTIKYSIYTDNNLNTADG